jgi:hypothetical protein
MEAGSGQNVDLVPGTYSTLKLRTGSRARLRAGTYFLEALSVDAEAVVEIDNTLGPVFVYISTTFAFEGEIREVDHSRANILFGYAGNQPAFIAGSFHGIVIAPTAALSILPGRSGHTGSFFAHAITLGKNVVITHQPLDPKNFCAAGGACTAFCPCSKAPICEGDTGTVDPSRAQCAMDPCAAGDEACLAKTKCVAPSKRSVTYVADSPLHER